MYKKEKCRDMRVFEDLDYMTMKRFLVGAEMMNRVPLSEVTRETLRERYGDAMRLRNNIRRAIGGDIERYEEWLISPNTSDVNIDNFWRINPVNTEDGYYWFCRSNLRKIEEYDSGYIPEGDDATYDKYMLWMDSPEAWICKHMCRLYQLGCENRILVMWEYLALYNECEEMEAMADVWGITLPTDGSEEQRDGSPDQRPDTSTSSCTIEGEAHQTGAELCMCAKPDALLNVVFMGNKAAYDKFVSRCRGASGNVICSTIVDCINRHDVNIAFGESLKLYLALQVDPSVNLPLTWDSFRNALKAAGYREAVKSK